MEKYKLKNCSLQYNSSYVHNDTNVALPFPSPSPKVSENSPRLTSGSLMPQNQIYGIFISVFNQLDAQNLFHNKFYFMPLHVSSTCARNM